MESTALSRVIAAMPLLADLPPPLAQELSASLVVTKIAAGTPIFRETDSCPGFPIVLNGRVRVMRSLDNGRELNLYDVEPGESCVMSTGCMLGNMPYRAHGTCLTEVELALIPRPLFDRLVAEFAPFRNEVFGLFTERLSRLMELVEAVGFQRLDQRLAAALLGKGQKVEASHEQLAQSLGVSRESVSRQLKHFEEGLGSAGARRRRHPRSSRLAPAGGGQRRRRPRHRAGDLLRRRLAPALARARQCRRRTRQ
ncbi:MAG: Crp/Fnr family transcriptional regulator [Burkholderiaceae bacterium]|nr:Crp/Fnr family transcriptional regulator [Burkholderiaceae bacterium]